MVRHSEQRGNLVQAHMEKGRKEDKRREEIENPQRNREAEGADKVVVASGVTIGKMTRFRAARHW